MRKEAKTMSKLEKVVGVIFLAVIVVGVELAFFHAIEYGLY